MATAVIDHVFICGTPGAPAAQLLASAGLTEGTPNRHPGQGTACRRFFFSNAMLEFLWLENEAEARSGQTRATRLWERLSGAAPTASPFGVILRPALGSEPLCPWPAWSYRPPTIPGLELEIASNTSLEEPMWFYMKTGRAPADWPPERRQPFEHSLGLLKLTGALIGCPAVNEGSVTQAMARGGVIALQTGVEHVLELQFEGGTQTLTLDFRPALPLIFRLI